MFYNQYLVKDTDQFNPEHFPKVTGELDAYYEAMKLKPSPGHMDMLLSCVRDYESKTEWIYFDPELADLIRSKSLSLNHVKGLFLSCIDNQPFRTQLETYIQSGNRTAVTY
ncbi:MAG TPA: hypothetical protein VFQ73_00795 [Flavisolibacter sp.]|nr:hypothetical protein [Flavisolibacter sp.]